MGDHTMVTLKDIAIACNVSISTVSRSLRNERYIEEKVKKLVFEKANEICSPRLRAHPHKPFGTLLHPLRRLQQISIEVKT
jgi:hypothetical protein